MKTATLPLMSARGAAPPPLNDQVGLLEDQLQPALAHWHRARLGQEWRAKGERGEVPRLLRRLQAIRVGTLRVAGQVVRRLLTQISAELNGLLERLGLLHLFGQPPPWAQA